MDWWYDKMVNGDVYEYSTAGTYIVTVPSWGANVAVVTACGAGGGGGAANGEWWSFDGSSGEPGGGYGGGRGAGGKGGKGGDGYVKIAFKYDPTK